MKTKECKRCNKTLILDDFPKNKSRKDGVGTYCKKCMVRIQKEYYDSVRSGKREASHFKKPSQGESFADKYPNHIHFWSQSNSISPYDVSEYSAYKALWECPENHHQWERTIKASNRIKPENLCPECKVQGLVPHKNFIPDSQLVKVKQGCELWWSESNSQNPEDYLSYSPIEIEWICPENNHIFLQSIREFRFQCPVCERDRINRSKLSIRNPELFKELSENNSIDIENLSYNSARVVKWECKDNHEWETTVYQRVNSVTGCPICSSGNGTSQAELEIYEFITSISGNNEEIICNDREVIAPFELDIYLPSKKIAIEYNGLYWHSDAKGKTKNYHKDKQDLCEAQGIQLITIWEDEWVEKNSIVRDMISHKLGLSTKDKLFARNTYPCTIDINEARTFCNNNHIQGFTQGSAYLGLRSKKDGSLVALSIWRKNKSSLYLDRYCTNKIVIGGMGKLLKSGVAFAQENNLTEIISFADRTVSDGNLYNKLGFTLDKVIKPDYKYLWNKKRIHKSNFRLKNFKSNPELQYKEGLSETQLAILNSIPRIWDAGKIRYVLNIENN